MTDPADPPASPQEELARLAAGLRAAARRQAWRGTRRIAAPKAPTPERHQKGAQSVEKSPISVDSEQKAAASDPKRALTALREEVAGCQACRLCETRTQTVFGDGTGRAGVVFVGEAPGQHEDEQGVPFVGRAGALLTDIIQKGMGLKREDVYIANVLKCRPPGNRDPKPDETRTCTPFLDRQIELLNPKVLVPLGLHASQHILKSTQSMGRLRGKVHRMGGRVVIPTYHPAYLLRSPHMKKECWKDIQLVMAELGLPLPEKR